MFHQLRIRLTLICTAATAVILVIMAASSLTVSVSNLNQRGQISFTSDINSILYHIQSQTVLDHTWLSQTESNSRLILYLEDNGVPLLYHNSMDPHTRNQLIRQAQTIALTQYGFDLHSPPESVLQAEKCTFVFSSPDQTDYYGAAAVIPSTNGWIGLVALKSMKPEQIEILAQSWTFAGLVLLAVIGLGAFSWFFTGRAIRPIRENQRRQAEFVSAASHELRSPLAVIQASNSAMGQAPPDRAARFSETIGQECLRMSRLIEDLLVLAGADSGRWSIRREETDLETLVLDAAETYEPLCAEKGLQISVQCPQEEFPPCLVDPQRLRQALSILLENAVRYTPSGGKIRLSIASAQLGGHHPAIRISVSDTGPGIPDEEKQKIFDRFYRADSSRTDREHYGLGLSIAREIVTLHKGKLTVTDTPGGGSAFSICLPLSHYSYK